MKIGRHIRKIREERELNQVEFSQALDITQGYLSKVENGQVKPNFKLIQGLRKKFKIDLNEIIDQKVS